MTTKVLILGTGYIGAGCYYHLLQHGDLYELTGTYAHNQLAEHFVHLDVTKPDQVYRVVGDIGPQVIIHLGNNADPRWCEAHPQEARLLNETSTKTIVNAANVVGAKLFYFSSSMAERREGVYGETKWASEFTTTQAKSGWLIIRSGLAIGLSPKMDGERMFNGMLKSLNQGVSTVAYDDSRSVQATWIGHLAEILHLALQRNIVDQIIPVATREMTTRYELAQLIMGPFGVAVRPTTDEGRGPGSYMDVSMLTKLGLPTYTLAEVAQKTVQEIREQERFVL